MAMKTGLMTSAPIKEWQGTAVDLDGYLALVRGGGCGLSTFSRAS